MSDPIERQVAIVALRESRLARNPVYMTTAMQVIEKLPPAQPETATGIIRYLTDGLTMWYACDACGVSIGYKDHYCRNCGRKLKHEK